MTLDSASSAGEAGRRLCPVPRPQRAVRTGDFTRFRRNGTGRPTTAPTTTRAAQPACAGATQPACAGGRRGRGPRRGSGGSSGRDSGRFFGTGRRAARVVRAHRRRPPLLRRRGNGLARGPGWSGRARGGLDGTRRDGPCRVAPDQVVRRATASPAAPVGRIHRRCRSCPRRSAGCAERTHPRTRAKAPEPYANRARCAPASPAPGRTTRRHRCARMFTGGADCGA